MSVYFVSEANDANTARETYSILREPMNIHGVTVVWDSLVRLAQKQGWHMSVQAGNGYVWLECLHKLGKRWVVVKELTVQLPHHECGLPAFEFEAIG